MGTEGQAHPTPPVNSSQPCRHSTGEQVGPQPRSHPGEMPPSSGDSPPGSGRTLPDPRRGSENRASLHRLLVSHERGHAAECWGAPAPSPLSHHGLPPRHACPRSPGGTKDPHPGAAGPCQAPRPLPASHVDPSVVGEPLQGPTRPQTNPRPGPGRTQARRLHGAARAQGYSRGLAGCRLAQRRRKQLAMAAKISSAVSFC